MVEVLYGTRYQSGSVSLINVGNGFHCLRSFFFLFSFLTYMLMHYCKSNVKIELRFQFVCMNSHGSLNVARPSPPLVIEKKRKEKTPLVVMTQPARLMWLVLPPFQLYIMVFSEHA